MKVKELIEILKHQNPESEIIIDYHYRDGELGWAFEEEEERPVKQVYNAWDEEFHLSTYKQNLEFKI